MARRHYARRRLTGRGMKARTAYTLVAILFLVGCHHGVEVTKPVEILVQEPNWYYPGTMFPCDESNATDILVLTINVDDFIKSAATDWPYRRLTKREEYAGGGKSLGCHADGPRGGYGLSLLPSPLDAVSGTNIEFSIQYYGSLDGNRNEGKATITVPVNGPSSGRVEKLTYKSEWRPNKTSDAIGAEAAPQHQR